MRDRDPQPVAARRGRAGAGAWKDVAEVVDAAERAGLSKKVARLVPMATIKG